MKFVLAAVLCALMVKTVMVMPVAEPGTQSDQLAVVPLENGVPVIPAQHILRREVSESDVTETSVHREGETPEEHAKHAHLPTARLEQDAVKTESVKTEESKPLSEEVKTVEAVAAASEKKEEVPLKNEQVIEDAVAAKAAIPEIMTTAETLAPVPAVPAASVPVEDKVEPQVTEGKNAPVKEINSELKEVVVLEVHSAKAAEKTEEPQQIAKSLPDSIKSEAASVVEPIATVIATAESAPSLKDEKKIEPVVAESEQKVAEQPKEGVKEAEDKTDRVTRGTEETAPIDQLTSAAAATVESAAAAVAEPTEKLVDEIKEKKIEFAEKKRDVAEAVGTSENAEKSALAKSSETTLAVEASESLASAVDAVEKSAKVAEEAVTSEVKAAEQTLEAKSAPSELEAQPSAAAAAAPTEIKPEPVVDTIKVKAESTEASKESTEAVKAEDSSSSEEKSSEEDGSDEKSEKSSEPKSSGEEKKEESKVEELPKPQEVKEIKKDE